MNKKEELTQIVKKVQEDIGQFELLYSFIINRVYYWCYTILKNEADAKDATQDSMVRIHKGIHKLNNPEAFSTWMYRLVTNTCNNYLRRNIDSTYEFIQDDNYNESFETNIVDERRENIPHKAYDLNETKKIITEFIDNLPRRQREVITLHYLEEFKIDEIAEILNYKKGSVKSRLHSGRKSLELQIEDYQKKNNVKLYNVALVPIISAILQEQMEKLSEGLSFNADVNSTNVPKTSSLSKTNKISKLLKSNSLVTSVSASTIASAVAVTCVIVVVSVTLLLQNSNDIKPSVLSMPMIDNYINMYDKNKEYQYYESLEYSNFPTKDGVEIRIKLQQEIEDSKIKILFEDEEILFERDDMDIVMNANKNGNYQLQLNNEVKNFTIDNIDEYAPELISGYKYKKYIELVIDDKYSQIDYENSYVEYKNQYYPIPNDHKIDGTFEGEVIVVLFTKDNRYIRNILDF